MTLSGPTPQIFTPDEVLSAPTSKYVVTASMLAASTSRILSEPLIAQRLLSAECVALATDDLGGSADVSRWGHTLASAVAAMMPSCASEDVREQRERRRQQEHILVGQKRWPDLASVASAAFLLCADHKPPEYGLASQLYLSPGSAQLADWSAFESLVDHLLKTVSPIAAPAWLSGGQALRQALTTIIAETFKNTHDHARTEVNGASVACSLRGLYARFYPMDEILASIDLVSPSNRNQAEMYVRSFAPPPTRPGVRAREIQPISGFAELSVVDSGPGMAARWRKTGVLNVSPREQGDAVIACFKKGQSTTGSTGRGFGLWKVLLSLAQLKGFISVRTNGIHVFRQFGYGRQPGIEHEFGESARPGEHFYDWKRGFVTEPSPYPHVRGTVVSFLLPMRAA